MCTPYRQHNNNNRILDAFVYVCTALALVRCPIFARQRHGDLVDRVPVIRGRDGQHIRPGIVGPGG